MTDETAYNRLADLVGLRGTDEDEAELRAALERSPRLRERLDNLNRVHALLGASDPAPRPGDDLTDRVLAIPGLEGRPERRSWIVGRRGLTAVAAVIALLALVAGAVVMNGRTTGADTGDPIALVSSADSGMQVTIEMGEPEGGRQSVRLVAQGLYDDGQPYALWLIGSAGPSGGSGAVLVGEFAPDGKGECVVLLTAASNDWRAAVITQAGETPAGGTMARANLRST